MGFDHDVEDLGGRVKISIACSTDGYLYCDCTCTYLYAGAR